MAEARVVAVVVLYRPDPERWKAVYARLAPQVEAVVVVSNGAFPEAQAGRGGSRVEWLENPSNRGLAAAQNQGIERARRLGCTHVLLLDQDSLAAPDMVARLLAAEAELAARGERVGALGPRWRDPRSAAEAFFVRFRWFGSHRVPSAGTEDPLPVDALIGSGTLIPVAALAAVGGMNAGLFVYHVDTDWCLRARRQGLSLWGVPRASMDHHHGLGVECLGPGGGVRFSRRSPEGHYYIFRNSLLLYRLAHVPWVFVVRDLARLAGMALAALCLGPDRRAQLSAIAAGLGSGLLGREGARPAP